MYRIEMENGYAVCSASTLERTVERFIDYGKTIIRIVEVTE